MTSGVAAATYINFKMVLHLVMQVTQSEGQCAQEVRGCAVEFMKYKCLLSNQWYASR